MTQRINATRRGLITRKWAAAALMPLILSGMGCATGVKAPAVQPRPEPILRRVADHVLQAFPEPPHFNWGEGVLMAGMMRAGKVTRDRRYVDFVQTWADHWRKEGIGPVLEARGYCGRWGPGFPLLMLYEATGNESYLAMARQIVAFMQAEATRTRDGGLGHWRGNKQLWVDTLFMSCPVYVNAGRLASQPELVAEAAKQLIVSADHLQDAATGLFYHMYDELEDRRTEEPWGRGNGWTAMSYVEVLRHLDRSSPTFERVARDFHRLAEGLIATQNRDTGLWRTVLTKPEACLETSASAMILYSLVEGRRLDVIELNDTGVVQRAWSGLITKVDADGRVFDVSAGTGPTTYEKYAEIGRGTYPWGTGAFLLAASSLVNRGNHRGTNA